MSDCLETIIDAVHIECGWDTSEEVVARAFYDESLKVRRADNVWDYKSRLPNLCQGEHIGLPGFEVIRFESPGHLK